MKCDLSSGCPHAAECRAFKPKEIRNCPERNQIVKEMNFYSWQQINVSQDFVSLFYQK